MVLTLLTATLAWGAFAFGGVYDWAYRPLLVMSVLTGTVAWLRVPSRRPSWPIVLGVVATAIAIAVQLLPLSSATIRWISPSTDRLLRDLDLLYSVASVSNAPASHPLSISPEMTAIGLVFLLCASVLTLGTAQWLTRDRARHLAVVLATLGVVLSMMGIIQRAISPTVIYGFWKPVSTNIPFGPFVNRNHFAGWLVMVLPVALGLAIGLVVRSSRRPARDWRDRLVRLSEREGSAVLMASFSVAAMLTVLLATLSRSGIISAFVSIAIAAVLALRVVPGWKHLIGVFVLAAVVAVGIAAVGSGRLAERFGPTGTISYQERVGMWEDTRRMIADFPIVGVGVRAFRYANLKYQTNLPEYHVGSAHNDWLQLAAEGGLLVGLPALALLSALVVETMRRFRGHRIARDFGTTYWIRAGAATGLLGICLQSLVDFSLEMPGNTMLFATLWAIAIAPMDSLPHARAER